MPGFLQINTDFTDKELQKLIGWEINRVTGRRNELVALKRIEIAGEKVQNERRVTTWRACHA